MRKTEGRIPLPSICPRIFLLCVPYDEIFSVSPGLVCHQSILSGGELGVARTETTALLYSEWKHLYAQTVPWCKNGNYWIIQNIVRVISPPYYGKTSHNSNSQTPPILVSSSKGTHKSASLTTHWCTCSSTRRSNVRNNVLGAKTMLQMAGFKTFVA